MTEKPPLGDPLIFCCCCDARAQMRQDTDEQRKTLMRSGWMIWEIEGERFKRMERERGWKERRWVCPHCASRWAKMELVIEFSVREKGVDP